MLAANDIIDVIGAHVELKPAGHGRFVGLCPFHSEKTPSFSVNRDRQMYYCFGCGKSGDAYKFLQDNEGLSFVDAVKRLADRAGIVLPAVSAYESHEDAQRAQLIELCKFAQKHFRENLESALKGGIGRKYLATRKLQDATIKKFGLGYALDGWDHLVSAARGAKFKDSLIEAAGLARRGERGSIYDFFRNRLMFPIRDTSGNIVAFGGRDLGTDKSTAKYINTNEGPLYKKSRTLYGLFEARESLREAKVALLVEGYFDLLRCVDSGIPNVVASCGTALTREQAALLHRYVREVVLVYDGDAAGIRAALRGVGILVGAGLSVRVLALPEGMDPDDFVLARGKEAFQSLIDHALDFVSFHVHMNEDRTRTIEGRSDVAKELFATFALIEDELRRAEYIKLAAKELGLDPWNLAREYRDFTRGKEVPGDARSTKEVTPTFRPIGPRSDECFFVQALLHSEPLVERVRESMDEIVLAGPVGEIVRALMAETRDLAAALESDAARELLAAASNLPEYDAALATVRVETYLNRLKRQRLETELQLQNAALTAAKQSNNVHDLTALTANIITLKRKIESIGAV